MPSSMLVKDHMVTEVVTLHPDMEILWASQVLISSDVSGAPVLDQHGRLVGVLTERDLLKVVVHAGYHGQPGGLVRNYMNPEPVSVAPGDTILELAIRFIKEGYRRYPVIDGGRLVGVISRRDVLRAIDQRYGGKRS